MLMNFLSFYKKEKQKCPIKRQNLLVSSTVVLKLTNLVRQLDCYLKSEILQFHLENLQSELVLAGQNMTGRISIFLGEK